MPTCFRKAISGDGKGTAEVRSAAPPPKGGLEGRKWGYISF